MPWIYCQGAVIKCGLFAHLLSFSVYSLSTLGLRVWVTPGVQDNVDMKLCTNRLTVQSHQQLKELWKMYIWTYKYPPVLHHWLSSGTTSWPQPTQQHVNSTALIWLTATGISSLLLYMIPLLLCSESSYQGQATTAAYLQTTSPTMNV